MYRIYSKNTGKMCIRVLASSFGPCGICAFSLMEDFSKNILHLFFNLGKVVRIKGSCNHIKISQNNFS